MNNMMTVNHLSTLNSTSRKNSCQLTEDETLFSQLLQTSESDNLIPLESSELPLLLDEYQDGSSSIIVEIAEVSDNLALRAEESTQEDPEVSISLVMLAATGFVIDTDIIEDDTFQYHLSTNDSIQVDEDNSVSLDNIKCLQIEQNNSGDKKRDLSEHLQIDDIEANETESASNIMLKMTRSSSTILMDNNTNSVFQNTQNANNTAEPSMDMFGQQSAVNTSTLKNQDFISSLPTAVSSIPISVSNPHWQDAFNQQISLSSRQDIQKAEIRLNPEELGSLHIKLEMNDGKMHLQMIAAHSFVKGIVELAVPNLRISLAEQGIDLQDVDVSDSVMQNNSEQESMFEKRQHSRNKSPISSPLETEITIEREVPQTAHIRSGLSIFA